MALMLVMMFKTNHCFLYIGDESQHMMRINFIWKLKCFLFHVVISFVSSIDAASLN